MSETMDGENYLEFLKQLEKSDAKLNDWESSFTADNVKRDQPIFSEKQAKCIDRMIDKYGDEIGW